jgi:DNA (cytosine-5)-methyltransferase 1
VKSSLLIGVRRWESETFLNGKARTLGSLFAGIGGFDLGFRQAGFKTTWQVEINPVLRAVLADRFPEARQFADVRECGAANLSRVDCITAGFPCQDLSVAGSRGERKGLEGERSGLFREVVRIVEVLRPQWLVLENVPGLLFINDGRDFQAVLSALSGCGYVGYWRVLNAQYFGVPQNRRRVFMVAGLGRYPSIDFLADAAPVEAVPSASGQVQEPRPAVSFAGPTLTAANTPARIGLGSPNLVAEEDGWDSMVERQRMSEVYGLSCGLDDANFIQTYASGNAVVPAVARWVAEKLR